MTPEQYATKRLLILESTLRNLMGMLCQASPALAMHIDMVGRNWDEALDRLELECTLANSMLKAKPEGETN